VPVGADDVLAAAVVGEHRAHGAVNEEKAADDRVSGDHAGDRTCPPPTGR
jgi:hypothetical protein